MIAKLTDEQRHALETSSGKAVPIEDDQNCRRYFLVGEEAYLHLQGLQDEHERQCHERLRQLIDEGIQSPGVPAAEAFARLKTIATNLLQSNA